MHVTVSIFENARTNRATRETVDFGSFLDDFKQPAVSDLEPTVENAKTLKKGAPAFSPALFKEDARKKANVEQAQVLAFDIDSPIDAREISDRLRRRGINYAIHHTTSAGFSVAVNGQGGVHVLIPLARTVDHETYLRYWDEAASIFHGIEIDRSKRGAESLFFVPVIFSAHRKDYYFDACVDGTSLGASGFKPFRPELSLKDKYAREVREASQKHVTLNRVAFTYGLLGLGLEETRTQLLEALRDNVVSTTVSDWNAAEHTLVGAWTDGNGQREAENARPKYVPAEAKGTGKRVLKEACVAIGKGEELGACAYRVGQFVPHVLAYEHALDALKEAWERAKNHDTRSLADAVSELVGGLDNGVRAPKGLHEEWTKELKLTPDGLGYHAGENNVHVVLEKHPELLGLSAFDVRDGAPVYLSEPPWHAGRKLAYPRRLVDADRQHAAIWVRDKLGVPNVSPKVALTALIDIANGSQHDALLQYYKSLPSDSQVDLLEGLLIDTMGADDNAYVRAVTKRWLISIVARQFVPGCKVDHMLITIGDQGLRKSTFFQELFPLELQDQSFTDTLNMLKLDKDQVIKLARYAVVEIGELSALNKSDIETVKMAITQRRGDERAAYAALHAQYPRRAVFCGTTNKDEFLRDPTGNRRFWPVPINSDVDLEKLRTLRNKVWAQAVSAYLRGEVWYLTKKEENLAAEMRERHEEQDVLTEAVRALLTKWPGESKYEEPTNKMQPWQLEGDSVVRVRVGQLMGKLGADLTNMTVQRRVSDCLRRLGWRSRNEWHDKVSYRIWYKR
jgi:predicted P-loop ATPase